MLQHSLMSRQRFQQWVKRRGLSPPFERLAHLLCSCAAVQALLLCWRPLPGLVYALSPSSPLYLPVQALAVASFAFVLASLVTATYYDLFNFRGALGGTTAPGVPEVLPAVYRCTRQPLFSALLGVLWCSPRMVHTAAAYTASGEESSQDGRGTGPSSLL